MASTRTRTVQSEHSGPTSNAGSGAPDFSGSDGSGRQLRPVQTQALNWLSANWNRSDVFAICAPTGAGKSMIAETIKQATGGHVLTPTNLLIDQYIDTYPAENFLKGKDHYKCRSGLTCAEWTDVCEMPACDNCPYSAAKARAKEEPTFFNPMSYWYFGLQNENAPKPKVLVVDEAHGLASFLSLLAGARLRKSEYHYPPIGHELALINWLEDTVASLVKLRDLYRDNRKEYLRISTEIKSLKGAQTGLMFNPENYAIWTEPGTYRGKRDEFLNIRPVKLPRNIADRVLNADKVILLSGTLPETDVRELIGDRSYLYLDLPSPIPVERRRVYADPVPFKMNYLTPPASIAAAIEARVAESPLNTLVHVSYDMSRKLAPLLPRGWKSNVAETKELVLGQFKDTGGVFLAAGCAEGLDLKDDLCRHNVIPKLMFPNLNDPSVKKRRALPDGEEWYAMTALKTLIQQAGRSTRNERDGSVTRVLDPNFAATYRRWKHKLPASFCEAVVWSRPTEEAFKQW